MNNNTFYYYYHYYYYYYYYYYYFILFFSYYGKSFTMSKRLPLIFSHEYIITIAIVFSFSRSISISQWYQGPISRAGN